MLGATGRKVALRAVLGDITDPPYKGAETAPLKGEQELRNVRSGRPATLSHKP